jgi:N,N'-diacetyllegionaminate synthase
MRERVFIIAEAGVNHNGSLILARKLVEEAARAGADAVKFQTFRAETLVSPETPKAAYQQQTTDAEESQFDMIRRLELSPAAHRELIEHCRKMGIQFLSSAFDLDSIDLLAELGLEIFKIPSGEITNLPYLLKVGNLRKPTILSTGMATMAEIAAAIKVLEEAGVGRDMLTVLHCNTEYPTPMDDVNLRAMLSIGEEFGVKVGYSDHTLGGEVSIAAVALGASVIEKHFSLDSTLPGPDHRASLEPAGLQEMVTAIRHIEVALGDGIKRPSASERKNLPFVRKAIVAARDITEGETFDEASLTVKRPAKGLNPMLWDEIIGQRAKRAYRAGEPIER